MRSEPSEECQEFEHSTDQKLECSKVRSFTLVSITANIMTGLLNS